MKTLSDRARNVLTFIANYQDQNGFSPSLSEITREVGLKSLRGASLQLESLERRGYIHRDKGARRAIKVLRPPQSPVSSVEKVTLPILESVKMPILGEIRAGPFSLADQEWTGEIEIPKYLLHGREDAFLLKVKGTSMNKAGYNPGDIVVFVPQSSPTTGDIVIARKVNEEEATLKRFKRIQNFIALVPESSDAYEPIIGSDQDFEIQGRVIDKVRAEQT